VPFPKPPSRLLPLSMSDGTSMRELETVVAPIAVTSRPARLVFPHRFGRYSSRSSWRRRWPTLVALGVMVLFTMPTLPTGPVQSASSGEAARTSHGVTPVGGGTGDLHFSTAPSAAASLSKSLTWSLLSSSVPGARTGAGFGAWSRGGRGVLFGGQTTSGLTNSTLLYNESLNRWLLLRPTIAPTPRSDFGFASDPVHGTAVLYGGLVNLSNDRVSNETWSFSFATNNWTDITPAVSPGPRSDPAFAVGNGIALLYGGQEPNSSGSGQLTYFDTWMLNLTTDLWTRVGPPGGGGPGPLYGASMVWNPTQAAFLLFGGCEPCSSSVWSFSPVSLTWSSLPASGAAPRARMGMTWTWDPLQRLDLLYGGKNSTTAFNDTYLFDPATTAWTRAAAPQFPSARSDSAADFLAVPGNETLLITGGTYGSTILPDAWRLAPVANLTVWVTNASSHRGIANASVGVNGAALLETNLTGGARITGITATETAVNASAPGYGPFVTSVWIPPATNATVWLNLTPLAPATLFVLVTDPNGTPLPNVSVNVSYGLHLLHGSPHFTNSSGVANFTQVPSAVGTVSASFARFHSSNSSVDFLPGQTIRVHLTLNPLLELQVETLGKMPDGTVATLQGVAITVQGLRIGLTAPDGWLNDTTAAFGLVDVGAAVYGFATTTRNITANYTGRQDVVLTLSARPFASLTVQVLGVTGSPVDLLVRNARVNVTNTTSLPTGSFRKSFSTGVDGKVSLSLLPGNYSFQVWARGFGENDSVPNAFERVSASASLVVDLIPLPLSSLHVLVRSSAGDHPPIPGASVLVNFTNLNLSDGASFQETFLLNTSGRGWANFSSLPASLLLVNGSAPGYEPNDTVVPIGYGQYISPFILELTPAPPVRTGSLTLFTGDPVTLLTLVLLPILTLVGALVYLTMLRNPSSHDEAREETRPRPSTETSARERP
jgi:Galactose oxidase, central domain